MAEHGYAPEYDEATDQRGGWRDEGLNPSRREDRARDPNFMFGDREDHDFDRERARRDFRSSMDHHYRSWRDRQMEGLDRDYEDYCREREQQFHSDFDEWRRRRHGNPQPLRTGMTQTGMSHDPSGELQLTEDQRAAPTGGSNPMATATLGNESESER